VTNRVISSSNLHSYPMRFGDIVSR